MKTTEQIQEIIKAISKMQGSMNPAIKDVKNEFFKSRYADLASIWMALRTPMSDNDLCVLQDVVTFETGISIVTRISHSSGQWIEFGPLAIHVISKKPQDLGAAITYGKRYALCAALGIVTDDDDDCNAQNGNTPLPSSKQTIQPAPAQLTEQPQPLPMKTEGYDEFVAKHELVQGSRKFQYIERVMKASAKSGRKRDIIDVINGAMKDEAKFLDAYHGYEMKQLGKPKEPELPAPQMTDVAAV